MQYENESMDVLFRHMVSDLLDKGARVGNTWELRNVYFTLLDPYDCLVQSRGISRPYLLGEHVWYLKHLNSTEFICKFAPYWGSLSDDGITNNSAYGYIMEQKFGFDQLKLVIDILKNDVNSRRGVLNLNTPNPNRSTTKDEPCTIMLQFYVREGKVELTAVMRSSDIWLGIPYDVPYFTTLQKIVADALGLPVGPYHHFSVSLHLYDRNKEKAKTIHGGTTKTVFDAFALLNNLEPIYKFMESCTDFRSDGAKQDLLIRAYDKKIFTEVKV